MNESVSELSAEKHSLFEQVKAHEEKITDFTAQIEKLHHDLHAANDIIDESKFEYLSLNKDKEGVISELKTAEEQILRLKADIAKQKTMQENEINALIERSSAQEEKMKTLIDASNDPELQMDRIQEIIRQDQERLRKQREAEARKKLAALKKKRRNLENLFFFFLSLYLIFLPYLQL